MAAIDIPISTSNELRMFQELIDICERRLAKYPQSIADDIAQLQDEDLSRNSRTALAFTIEEKTIIQ